MTDAKAIYANPAEALSFVIKKDGSLWGWGNNWYGQLGVMRKKDRSDSGYIHTPRLIMKDVVSVSGNNTIFAIKPDKSLWSWGTLWRYRGDNNRRASLKPVKIMDNVEQVSSSSTHTLALKTDGTLFAWGGNQCGALGIGNTTDKSKPVRVNTKALGKRKILKIAARNGESFAITEDGSVWGWGEPNIVNPFCKDEPRLTPVRIDDMDNVKDVASGQYKEIYLKNDGTVWEWTEDAQHPGAEPAWHKVLDHVREIAAGDYHFIALKNDGTVWTWTWYTNEYGQLGNGTTRGSAIPVQVKFPK